MVVEMNAVQRRDKRTWAAVIRGCALGVLVLGSPLVLADKGPPGGRDAQDMSAQERERIQRWQSLPPEKREELMERYERFQKLSPEEQAEVKKRYNKWREMPEEERRAMRDKWQQMSPEERQALRRRQHEERADGGWPPSRGEKRDKKEKNESRNGDERGDQNGKKRQGD